MSKKAADSSEAFDSRLERLEALVGQLEGGRLGLEPALDLYREGVALLKGCQADLKGFKAQVEELTQGPDGLEGKPYAGDPDMGQA